MKTTGTWRWEREWCTAYDEILVTLPIPGYVIVPNKARYIDPDFEEDLKEAIAIGEEWSVICARRALKLGLAGHPVRHCPACGKLHVVGKRGSVGSSSVTRVTASMVSARPLYATTQFERLSQGLGPRLLA